MMIDNSIRRLWLTDTKRMHELRLSQHRVDVLNFITEKGKIYSSDVALRFKKSPQGASTIVKELYKLGYLRRIEEISISGGKEYGYIAKNLE